MPSVTRSPVASGACTAPAELLSQFALTTQKIDPKINCSCTSKTTSFKLKLFLTQYLNNYKNEVIN